jgi:hypothetical protein
MKYAALIPFGSVGLALTIFAGSLAKDRFELISNGSRCNGTVVDFRTVSIEDKDRQSGRVKSVTAQIAIIEFKDTHNTAVRFEARELPFSDTRAQGDVVPVIYLQQKPDTAAIDAFADLWIVPILCAALGLVALGAAVGMSRAATNG